MLTSSQDPAQYLVPNLSIRSHPSYFMPELYGTITGAALSANDKPSKTMKDGGMDWSGGKVAGNVKEASNAKVSPEKSSTSSPHLS